MLACFDRKSFSIEQKSAALAFAPQGSAAQSTSQVQLNFPQICSIMFYAVDQFSKQAFILQHSCFCSKEQVEKFFLNFSHSCFILAFVTSLFSLLTVQFFADCLIVFVYFLSSLFFWYFVMVISLFSLAVQFLADTFIILFQFLRSIFFWLFVVAIIFCSVFKVRLGCILFCFFVFISLAPRLLIKEKRQCLFEIESKNSTYLVDDSKIWKVR